MFSNLCRPEYVVLWGSVVRLGVQSFWPLSGYHCCCGVPHVAAGVASSSLGSLFCQRVVLVVVGISHRVVLMVVVSPSLWGSLCCRWVVLSLSFGSLYRCGLASPSWSFPPSRCVGLVIMRLPMSMLGCPRRPGVLHVTGLSPSIVCFVSSQCSPLCCWASFSLAGFAASPHPAFLFLFGLGPRHLRVRYVSMGGLSFTGVSGGEERKINVNEPPNMAASVARSRQ